jgi:membrane protease YdiL (CAAX protease family)
MPLPSGSRAKLAWVFRGSDGIRAFWSILLFVLVMAVPGLILAVVAHFLHLAPKGAENTLRPWLLVIREAISLVIILAATAVMARIERRPVWYYGLAPAGAVRKFLAGGAGGFATLSLLAAALAAGGVLVFDGLALHGLPILGYGALWLAAFILVGLSEETLFRGYVLTTLTRGIGFWPAALVSSLLFGAAHLSNKGETALGIVGVVSAGLVFCLLLRVSGSLWMAIGFHATWDWAQSYFYGTPDSGMLTMGHLFLSHPAGNVRFSGGLDGPEGSVLAAPVMVAGLLAMVWLSRRGRRLPSAAEAALPAE